MRTSIDIEAGLRDEFVAARVLRDMGYVPTKERPHSRIVRNRDGDTFERRADDSLVMVGVELSEPERIDHEMEQRGGLLRAIEPAPDEPAPRVRTSPDLWLPALIGVGLLVGALAINAIVGGGQ